MYEAYNELFFEEILENTGIKVAYEAFRDTSLFERYMLNTAQFSAAKDAAETKMMQAQIFRPDGTMKPFREFSNDVEQVVNIQQDTWLRVEYEMQKRQTVTIAQFTRMKEDADLYPYWVYRGRMDGRERPEHVAMEGKVFRIGDAAGDSCFPPIDWNCRCTGDSVDGRYLADKGVQPCTAEESAELLKTHVGDQFQFNPANHGPMPSQHSYMQVLHNANDANAEMFNKPSPPDNGPKLEGLRAIGLHYMMNLAQDWRKDYHTDHRGNIVFQNKKTHANVRLNDMAIHTIHKHSRGVANLPDTIMNPSEVWSKWEDVGKQTKVLRSYLLFGSTSYVVLTLDGQVMDAFACSNKEIKRYRTGVIIS